MMQRTFSQMDKDGDGLLNVADVKAYLQEVGRFSGIETVESWISLRDTNCDGFVTFDDFLMSFAPVLKSGPVQQSTFLESLESLRVQRSLENTYAICWEMLVILTKIVQFNSEKSWSFTMDDIPTLLRKENRPWCSKSLEGFHVAVDEKLKDTLVVNRLQSNLPSDSILIRADEIKHFMTSLVTPQVGSNLGTFVIYFF